MDFLTAPLTNNVTDYVTLLWSTQYTDHRLLIDVGNSGRKGVTVHVGGWVKVASTHSLNQANCNNGTYLNMPYTNPPFHHPHPRRKATTCNLLPFPVAQIPSSLHPTSVEIEINLTPLHQRADFSTNAMHYHSSRPLYLCVYSQRRQLTSRARAVLHVLYG